MAVSRRPFAFQPTPWRGARPTSSAGLPSVGDAVNREDDHRPLPHSLEAERSVLGAILLHNDALANASKVVDDRDFFRDAHRRIFSKMLALASEDKPIDLVTLKAEL